jgi:nucleolar complex protein 2
MKKKVLCTRYCLFSRLLSTPTSALSQFAVSSLSLSLSSLCLLSLFSLSYSLSHSPTLPPTHSLYPIHTDRAYESKVMKKTEKEEEPELPDMDDGDQASGLGVMQKKVVEEYFDDARYVDNNDDDDDDEDESDSDDQDDDADMKADKDADSDSSDDDDDGSSSDEDDEDAIERHKQELAELAHTDPEFHKHLMEENKDLLDFNPDFTTDAQIASGAIAQKKRKVDPAEESSEHFEKESSDVTTMTIAMFQRLTKRIVKANGLRDIKRLMRVFRSACHVNDDETEAEENDTMVFADSRVYNAVMSYCLRDMHKSFDRHLNLVGIRKKTKSDALAEANMAENIVKMKNKERFRQISRLIKSYLNQMLHFLVSLLSAANNSLIRLVIHRLRTVVPYMAVFPKVAQRFTKALIRIWSEAEDHTRIDAFVRIRQIALVMPMDTETMEGALKGLYLAYARNSKFTSARSLPRIQFMANCVVELYGLDLVAAYQHAFVYVRQLAIHLRNATVAKTKDSHSTVYNWQYLNSLRVWAKLLAVHASSTDSELYPLVYPFVQVCIGVMQLNTSFRFVPLRFTVARFVNQIVAETGLYVPLASHLLSVFESAEFNKRVRKSTTRPPDLQFLVRVSKNVANTAPVQQAVADTALQLLQEHFILYSYSISFPELIIPATIFLKRFAKSTKIATLRKKVSTFVEKLNQNAAFINKKRSGLNYAPRDMIAKGIDTIDTFKPAENSSTVAPLVRYANMQAKQTDTSVTNLKSGMDDVKDMKASHDRATQDAEFSSDMDSDEEDVAFSLPKKAKKDTKRSKKSKRKSSSRANDDDDDDEDTNVQDEVRDFNIDDFDDDSEEDDDSSSDED